MVNYLKDKNWQDVTLEELKEHWDMGINELPTPLTFDVARYMNAYVLGNIHGEGIDVRCSYQHEGAAIYHSKIKYDELREEFKKNGWVETDYDKWNAYFVKYDTEVVLHNKPHFNEVGYMEMNFRSDYSDDAYCIEDYYDHVEPKVEKKEEEQVDNHQRNPLHILKRCMSFLSEERGVAERFLEDNDAFTDTDCEYIISACQLLEKAIEMVEKSNSNIIERI